MLISSGLTETLPVNYIRLIHCVLSERDPTDRECICCRVLEKGTVLFIKEDQYHP